jgi:hypothetical protein
MRREEGTSERERERQRAKTRTLGKKAQKKLFKKN